MPATNHRYVDREVGARDTRIPSPQLARPLIAVCLVVGAALIIFATAGGGSPPESAPPADVVYAHSFTAPVDIVRASTVAVVGTPLAAPILSGDCELPGDAATGCFFQDFKVAEVVGGRLLSGRETATIRLRRWTIASNAELDGQAGLRPSERYLLFLYPYELERDRPVGDYQIVGGGEGMFEVGDGGALRNLADGFTVLADVNHRDQVDALIARAADEIGTTMVRGDPPGEGASLFADQVPTVVERP